MPTSKDVAAKVAHVQHGFKQMQEEATTITSTNTPQESFTIAKNLYISDIYQVRMVAVFILGDIAAHMKETITFLHDTVSKDESWEVQEILAQAFNQYCKDTGYEASLPLIKQWLQDKTPNVRRAVSEGLRIWNYRDYFKQHPDVAIQLLSQLKDDESEYVRKSVGNALRDISRKEKDLIRKELSSWDTNNKNTKQVYDLASKFL